VAQAGSRVIGNGTRKCRCAALSLLIRIALVCSAPAASAQLAPEISKPAPELTLRELLDAPQRTDTSWSGLRGNAVVLEFWATWCAPCVSSIPHLNALAEQFKNRPIRFISVTDEEKQTVTRFLIDHPTAGWVGLDDGDATFKRYDVGGRPQTCLIDSDGILRAITRPDAVDPAILEDLLRGKPLHITQPNYSPVMDEGPGAPTPISEVLIRAAQSVEVSREGPGAESMSGGRYQAWGLTVRDILSRANDIPPERIDAPEWCDKDRFDLVVVVPHGGDQEVWPLVENVLATTVHLSFHKEVKETNVYVLQKAAGAEPKLKVHSSSQRSGQWVKPGEIDAVGKSVGALPFFLQSPLGTEVVDETGLSGRFDFKLVWNPKHPNSIISAVREQLGLEIVRTQRSLPHIVVDTAEEPKTY
jgi:uncharacterized protein (TIGR03435 family)